MSKIVNPCVCVCVLSAFVSTHSTVLATDNLFFQYFMEVHINVVVSILACFLRSNELLKLSLKIISIAFTVHKTRRIH